MIEFARLNPNKLTVSNVGEGSGGHLVLEGLCIKEGIKMKHIPFTGATPAITALLGGHVMAAAIAGSGYAPHLKAKKVRLLAVLGEERMEEFPDVPTIREHGYPHLVYQSWYVIAGPKKMGRKLSRNLWEFSEKQ